MAKISNAGQKGGTPDSDRDWSDQITLCDGEGARPTAAVLAAEQAFVAKKMNLRRQNIIEGRDSMECVITDETVENLYSLGEIGWKDAIRLDHFAALSTEDKESLLVHYYEKTDEYLRHYENANKLLASNLALFDQANSLAVTALSHARTMSMTATEVDRLTPDALSAILTENYRDNNAKFRSNLGIIKDFVKPNDGFSLGLTMIEALRKYSAGKVATFSQYSDFCELIVFGEMGRLYRDALTSMRYGSLPRAAIKRAKECDDVYTSRMHEVVADAVSCLNESDLVILDDAETAMQPSA